jgi:hypothetical protein
MTEGEIIRDNLKTLVSPSTREVALAESVGGNAGMASYALNMEVSPEGRILYVGNAPERTNATVRIFVPAFSTRITRLHEIGVEVWGNLATKSEKTVTRAVWLWNLHREENDREILERFMEETLDWGSLLEILRAKYPGLVRELE